MREAAASSDKQPLERDGFGLRQFEMHPLVLEEADEALYWLEVVLDAKIFLSEKLPVLLKEANEQVCIFNAADMTAKKNRDTADQKISKSKIQK